MLVMLIFSYASVIIIHTDISDMKYFSILQPCNTFCAVCTTRDELVEKKRISSSPSSSIVMLCML